MSDIKVGDRVFWFGQFMSAHKGSIIAISADSAFVKGDNGQHYALKLTAVEKIA